MACATLRLRTLWCVISRVYSNKKSVMIRTRAIAHPDPPRRSTLSSPTSASSTLLSGPRLLRSAATPTVCIMNDMEAYHNSTPQKTLVSKHVLLVAVVVVG